MPGRISRDLITPSLNNIGKNLKNLPKEAFKVWVQNTPVKTGNARRSTSLRGNTIEANYQYAEPLDRGWSKQSPAGMTKPTLAYIKQRLKQIIRK